MPSLDARQRARLPASSFAYIDSRGRRLLPIHDEAHVRNALARFERVNFEDEAARKRARLRLLKAARKHGIVPVGFLTGQLDPERKLPTGAVTFLLSDIEDSTGHLARLGDGYSSVLSAARRILRSAVRKAGGHEVDARADEFFAAFSNAPAALTAALRAQHALKGHAWPDDVPVRVRMGIHSGRPTLGSAGYVGLAVHASARICRVAEGGQIVLSRAAANAIGEAVPERVRLSSLGEHRLRGLAGEMELFKVDASIRSPHTEDA